jgi:hypothetical protein
LVQTIDLFSGREQRKLLFRSLLSFFLHFSDFPSLGFRSPFFFVLWSGMEQTDVQMVLIYNFPMSQAGWH